jgi:hypothetical protein
MVITDEVMAMEIDLDAFLVVVYSLVDDLYRSKYAALKPRRRGHKPELSDSEVLTLAILCQWQRSRSENRFVGYVLKHWQGYFPRMLSQGAYNRRVRDLAGVLCDLGPAVARQTRAYLESGLAYEVIDGVPVPLMKRCRGSKHRLFGPEAAIGRGGSDREWYYGVKLLLAVSPEGQVTGFVFGPANTEERWLAEALLGWRADPTLAEPSAAGLAAVLGPSHRSGGTRQGPTGPLLGGVGGAGVGAEAGEAAGGLYLGDLGFRGEAWRRHWLEDYEVLVQTKRDYDQLAYSAEPEEAKEVARAGRRQMASLRQVIETVNGYLDEVLGLKYPRARSLWGLLARLGAKIAALNLAIHFNLSHNRPTLSHFSPLPDSA